MMNEKVTKRQMFEALINFAAGESMAYETEDGIVEITDEQLKLFAQHEIDLLDKKAAKAKESAAKRKKEDPLYGVVKDALGEDFQTIADITEDIVAAGYGDVTVAKVTYRLNKLVEAGEAEKTPVKIGGGDAGKARTVQAYRAATVADTE